MRDLYRDASAASRNDVKRSRRLLNESAGKSFDDLSMRELPVNVDVHDGGLLRQEPAPKRLEHPLAP
jgi:hypothetical protein